MKIKMTLMEKKAFILMLRDFFTPLPKHWGIENKISKEEILNKSLAWLMKRKIITKERVLGENFRTGFNDWLNLRLYHLIDKNSKWYLPGLQTIEIDSKWFWFIPKTIIEAERVHNDKVDSLISRRVMIDFRCEEAKQLIDTIAGELPEHK